MNPDSAPTDGDRTARPDTLARSGLFAATGVYVFGVCLLLARLLAGLAASLRLLRLSAPTGAMCDGIDILESNRVTSPVTLGILRPAIVLPGDWREWEATTREAVLAHERAHVRRRDAAVQLCSLIHRAILWHNPLSWFLHQRLVREAEAASDEAAVAVTGDRASYAEILLTFMQRAARGSAPLAVPMARYGSAAQRIDDILDGARMSGAAKRWSAAALIVLGLPLGYVAVTAQQGRPEFEAAAVYASARDVSHGGVAQLEGGNVRAGRYDVRRATLLDLITLAYGVRRDAVAGGPTRVDWDRFDIAARVPPGTRADTVRLMLQSLLAERFGLEARVETRPVPAYVLSKGTAPLRLRRATGSEESGCRQPMDRTSVSCRNMTMDAYTDGLQRAALTSRAVVNSTGLEGAWDFDLQFKGGSGYGIPDPTSGDTGIFEALRQVGLRLDLRSIPQPAVVIERVNEQPTANARGVEAALPPVPAEFEVASLRPCTMPMGITVRSSPGGLVSTGCSQLDLLIKRAWNLEFWVQFAPQLVLPAGSMDVPGLPPRLAARGFEITARSPVEFSGMLDANLKTMLRNLLIDRFRMTVHYEDRPMDVHALVAVKPRLTPADPSARSECRQSISPQQDVRGQILACQNVTMAQLAERLRTTYPLVASESQGRVVDETGLSGAWNFTLSWADAPFGVPSTPGGARTENRAASDPAGGVTLFDAVEKQLGLKLERRQRPVPVLVIDRIEENPTEN